MGNAASRLTAGVPPRAAPQAGGDIDLESGDGRRLPDVDARGAGASLPEAPLLPRTTGAARSTAPRSSLRPVAQAVVEAAKQWLHDHRTAIAATAHTVRYADMDTSSAGLSHNSMAHQLARGVGWVGTSFMAWKVLESVKTPLGEPAGVVACGVAATPFIGGVYQLLIGIGRVGDSPLPVSSGEGAPLTEFDNRND